MRRIRTEKRGISPVIATTLLIAMVVSLSLIVFLWFRGFTQESVTKFGGTNIDLVCKDLQFDASYSSPILSLSNVGNVPIYSFKLKIERTGSTQTLDITDVPGINWSNVGLSNGAVFSGNILISVGGANTFTVIPVLRGTSNAGVRAHICGDQYGKQIIP